MRTILDELLAAAEAEQPARFPTRPTVRIGRAPSLVIGLDHGNDAIKAAVLSTASELVTIRVPTAYREAELIRGGEGEVSYTVGGSTFWIGEVALRHDGDDLPIGPTRQRLIDPRLRALIAASVVELLSRAGYAPGAHVIALGFSIPNTEIVPLRGDGAVEGVERLGVDPETRTVLEEHLKGATWRISRSDPEGATHDWTLQLAAVLPQAQTAGTVLALTKAPNGATLTDIEEMDVIDIGGGDLQHTQVAMSPYQMLNRRIGDGTIRIARAVKERFPRQELNDVAAQHALITRRLLVSGKRRDISPEVLDALNAQGQAIVGAVLAILRQSRRFVVITGGGVLLLHQLLEERLLRERKVRGEDYTMINHDVASALNAIGALFGVIFRAAKRG